MVYVFLAAAIGLFIIGIRILGIVPKVKLVISASHDAIEVMKSPDMNEENKERAIQKAAVNMFSAFFSILVRVAVICLVPIGFVLFFAQLGFYANTEALDASTDLYFIMASTIAMIAALFFMR